MGMQLGVGGGWIVFQQIGDEGMEYWCVVYMDVVCDFMCDGGVVDLVWCEDQLLVVVNDIV